jgi:hypothetical protein
MTHGDQASDRYLPLLRDEIEERDPLILIEHDAERETSLAREPGLREGHGILLVHACRTGRGYVLGDQQTGPMAAWRRANTRSSRVRQLVALAPAVGRP